MTEIRKLPRLAQPGRRLIAVAAAACFLFGATRLAAAATDAPGPGEAAQLSVVVAPFANLSGDAAQDYLADGLTDELTSVLARIPGSFVIARNTAFTYKGKAIDAKAMGADLGVRAVLEGALRPDGDRVGLDAELIDADSGARLWGEHFDVARGDLMQTSDTIVGHLTQATNLAAAEAAPAGRVLAADPKAGDLALQCAAATENGGFVGPEAEATFRFCEQALASDPDNVRALSYLSLKFWFPVGLGRSGDPEGDLERADELVSHALRLDPSYAAAHAFKASILELRAHFDEAIAEDQRALALDPSLVDADAHLGWTYLGQGRFQQSSEYFDKAIRVSPRDPGLGLWVSGDTAACFGAKRYDRAIAWARRAIAINPRNVFAHGDLIAALALTGHDAEAHEALQNYLAIPLTGVGTLAAFKAFVARLANPHSDPGVLEGYERTIEGLRKAGMPEE